MKKGRVAILGCGWLGLPLLRSLVAAGYTVNGSSRNPETLSAIETAGGRAFALDLPGEVPRDFVGRSDDTLIITLPPRGRALGAEATANYLACLQSLEVLNSSSAPRVIFTSSTGIYGDATGVVTEQTPLAPSTYSGRAVAAAEVYLRSTLAHLTIIRLAGLVASDRHPGRFFGGRERVIPSADAPVNLVHRKDVIAAIAVLLATQRPEGEVYNVCAAIHPPKGAYYRQAAVALGLDVRGKQSGGGDGKVIDSTKLRALGWQPVWDDLRLEFL